MKREDWIEIAKKAGAASFYPAAQEVSKDSFIVGEQFLNRFAKLVEQATLERAAKVCEEYGGIISGNECAEAVRALKDSHD